MLRRVPYFLAHHVPDSWRLSVGFADVHSVDLTWSLSKSASRRGSTLPLTTLGLEKCQANSSLQTGVGASVGTVGGVTEPPLSYRSRFKLMISPAFILLKHMRAA